MPATNGKPKTDLLIIFMRDIGRCPKLTRSQQEDLLPLARRGDQGARSTLILSVLPWVIKLAARWKSRESLDEIVSWAMPAVCKAVDKWDPSRGALTTAVETYVFRALVRETTRNRVVPLPLSKPPKQTSRDHYDQSVKRIAVELDLQSPLLVDRAGGDPVEACERVLEKEIFAERLPRLEERERKVVELRMTGMTYKEIGELIGVTREYVRQILMQAIEQLQRGGIGKCT